MTDPGWYTYSSRFYERRWIFPLMGAAFEPFVGADGLIAASLLAYALLGPLIYL